MRRITIRILDGADRGRLFDELPAPVTIGREEGNTIQLNDERVSRFHLKIQEDHEKLVLTDLESTNGTKVNGEDIQLRILRFGDMIALGRSVLLFGSRDEIAGRLAGIKHNSENGHDHEEDDDASDVRPADRVESLDFELNLADDPDMQATLHLFEPPMLPERMTPGQAAQLAELLEYLHIRIRQLLNSVKSEGRGERLSIDQRQWQNLLDLQSRLATYLRLISEPGE